MGMWSLSKYHFTVLTLLAMGEKMPTWDEGRWMTQALWRRLSLLLTFRRFVKKRIIRFQTANDRGGTKTAKLRNAKPQMSGENCTCVSKPQESKVHVKVSFVPGSYPLFSSYPPAHHHHPDTLLTFQVFGLFPPGQSNPHDLYRSWWIVKTQEPCAPRNQVKLTSL